MKIDQFISYDFHDSVINSVDVIADGSINMVIDFCQWRQKGYKEENPELELLNVTFVGAAFPNGLDLKAKLSTNRDASILSLERIDNDLVFTTDIYDYTNNLKEFYQFNILHPKEILFNS